MWQRLRGAIFTGERDWSWRRRLVITSAAVNIAGIIKAAWFPGSDTHAQMVMSACQTGLMGILALYVVGAVADRHLKSKTTTQQASETHP